MSDFLRKFNLDRAEFGAILVDSTKVYLGVRDLEILCIYDVSAPETPAFVAMVDYRHAFSSPTTKMIKDGAYLYAGTGSSVHIVDVSDPAAPRLFANEIALSPADFVVRDRKVFIGSGSSERTVVGIFDVTNPEEPQEITRIIGPQWSAHALGFNQHDHLVYSRSTGGLSSYGYVYDLSNIQAPTLLKEFPRSRWGVKAAVFANGYEVTGGTDGIGVFDHRNAPEVELVSFTPSSNFVMDMSLADDLILIRYQQGVALLPVDRLPDISNSRWISAGSDFLNAVARFDKTRLFGLVNSKLKLLDIPSR